MDVDGGGLGSGGASLSSASSTGMGSAGFESPTRSGGGSGSAEESPESVLQPPGGGEGRGAAELEDELAGRLQHAAEGNFPGGVMDLPRTREELEWHREQLLNRWDDSLYPSLFVQTKLIKSRQTLASEIDKCAGVPTDAEYIDAINKTAEEYKKLDHDQRLVEHGLVARRHGPLVMEKLARIDGALSKVRQVPMNLLRTLVFRGGEATAEEVKEAVDETACGLNATEIAWTRTTTLYGQNTKLYTPRWNPLRILCISGISVHAIETTTWPQVVFSCGVQTGYKVDNGQVVPDKDGEPKSPRMAVLVKSLQRTTPYDWLAARDLLHVNLLHFSIVLCMDFKMH